MIYGRLLNERLELKVIVIKKPKKKSKTNHDFRLLVVLITKVPQRGVNTWKPFLDDTFLDSNIFTVLLRHYASDNGKLKVKKNCCF